MKDNTARAAAHTPQPSRVWRCNFCSHQYDEALGDPEHGIAPGTRLEDIADDWVCPDCGATKADYVPVD